MNRLIEFFVKKELFANLLTLILVLFGIFALLQIRREMFPNVSFDIITVNVVYPGASPEEVEKLIINPIEQDLNEVDGIKRLQSYSLEGGGNIVVTLDPDQVTEAEAKSDIQDVIDQYKKDLPEGAEDPIVTSVESKQTPVIEVTVGGNAPELELRSIAKDIEKKLEKIKEVAKVVPNGLREKEIHIKANPQKLAKLHISLNDLITALKAQNVAIPGGILEVDPNVPNSRERLVRTVGEFEEIEDIAQTVIRANDYGRAIFVKDVADIEYALKRPNKLFRTNGLSSINLTVLKKEKADAIDLVNKLKTEVAELQQIYGDKIELNLVNDSSQYIIRRLNVLKNNLGVGLILVLIILCLVLPFRVALLVAFGIPFAFLGAMIIFYLNDLSINLISMIGLIIVAGMLVDDAVIVMDNAFRLMEKEGLSPQEAAIKGTQQIWPAVTASVATTICVFIPMLLMSGIFGKFVRQIPLGVMIPLAISLLEVFFIMPAHIATWIKAPLEKRKKESESLKNHINKPKRNYSPIASFLKFTSKVWDEKCVPSYIRILTTLMKFKYITLGCVGVLFFSVVFGATQMKFILFPSDGIETFFIRAEAPVGTSLTDTGNFMRPLEAKVAKLPEHELKSFVTHIGIQMQDPNDPNRRSGSHIGQIAVYLTPESNRERLAKKILESIRSDIGPEIPPGLVKISFDEVNPGPPVGKPVDVGVRGDSYEKILPAVEKMKEFIASQEGTSDIDDSYNEGKQEIHVKVNASEAAAAALNVSTVGNTIRAAYEGIIATSIQELDDEIDIRVNLPTHSKTKLEVLKNIKIPNQLGHLIPLKNIAEFKETVGVTDYSHEDQQRQVRITAMLDTDQNTTSRITPILAQEGKKLEKEFPGVTFHFGGEAEDTNESLSSLFQAFALSLALILLILVFLFQNILQPLLVVLVIPLGIISAIASFFFHGLPISFMGMLGIIALGGVIVNNAIVFIDFVNQKRLENYDLMESIIETARVRARPIFLTSITTVCGLLPTAYGIGGMDRFVRPIALALGWGLVVGSFLTAYVIPLSIAVTDDIRALFRKKKQPASVET